MHRAARKPLIPLTALVAACVLGACGSGDGSAPSLLRQTFNPHSSVRSGRLDVSVALNLHGLQRLKGPVDFRINGPFQGHGPKQVPDLDIGLQVASAGQSFKAGLTTTGLRAWLNFGGTNYAIPDSVYAGFRNSYIQSAANAARQHSNSFSAFGIDPSRWLINPRKVGTADVSGASTTQIKAGVDVQRFLADISTLLAKANKLGVSGIGKAPASISPAAQAALAAAVTSANVDIYTGKDDHVLRRLRIAVALAVPQAERASVGGLSDGTIGFDLVISALNQPQHVNAPANARPLGDLLGGGAAGAGGTPAPATNGGGQPPGGGLSAPQPYLDCVQRAHGNIAAIQRCSSLLGNG